MDTKTMERFDVMTEEMLCNVDGGSQQLICNLAVSGAGSAITGIYTLLLTNPVTMVGAGAAEGIV